MASLSAWLLITPDSIRLFATAIAEVWVWRAR